MKKECDNSFQFLKRPKLQDQVRESILNEIKRGSFPSGKLPTEGKLAEMLGVSRPTISITLAYLEREGVVVRRHGSATYINKGYNNLKSLINQGIAIYDLIEQNGYEPSLLSDKVDEIKASDLFRELENRLKIDFELESDETVYSIRRVFGANGKPCIVTYEFIPKKHLKKSLDTDRLPETIYKLSEEYCYSPIEFTLVDIIPFNLNDELTNLLSCNKEDLVLLTEEIHLNNQSCPVIYSKVFVLDKYIRYQAIRIRE